jgi:hypothetical protein
LLFGLDCICCSVQSMKAMDPGKVLFYFFKCLQPFC